jgi:hypothetical protein
MIIVSIKYANLGYDIHHDIYISDFAVLIEMEIDKVHQD